MVFLIKSFHKQNKCQAQNQLGKGVAPKSDSWRGGKPSFGWFALFGNWNWMESIEIEIVN